jgi:MGT family glycosyltransferase
LSRYLFVVPPFASHIHPTIAIGFELARRGHAVAWVTYAAMKRVFPEDVMLYPLESPVSQSVADDVRRRAGASWMPGLKVLYEQVVVPMAKDMLPGVEAAIADFRPDALVVDQQAIAGALAARRNRLPFATSSTSAALLGNSFGGYPKVEEWVVTLFDRLQRDAAVEPVRWPDRSPALVILYTSRAIAGPDIAHPAHYCFVGPALEGRPEPVDFPWTELREGRRIFVSLGTLLAHRGERFFRTVVEALADAPMQVIVHAPPELIAAPPENFIVRGWVPLVQLLPRLDAIVCHAGTTANEGLGHGIPAVLAPAAYDQSIYAQRVVDAGAGVRVRFSRLTADELSDAVFKVVDDPRYRAAARRVQASFAEAGGACAAATAIERLR